MKGLQSLNVGAAAAQSVLADVAFQGGTLAELIGDGIYLVQQVAARLLFLARSN